MSKFNRIALIYLVYVESVNNPIKNVCFEYKLSLIFSVYLAKTIFFDYNIKRTLLFLLRNNRLAKLGRRGFIMSKTVVRDNESLEDALRRFKRDVSKTGTLREARKREFYEKPSVKRKKKSEAARKRKF